MRGSGTHKTLSALKNASGAAGRLLLHSSQTGWHPNRVLHPKTAAAGPDNTRAGQEGGGCNGSEQAGGQLWGNLSGTQGCFFRCHRNHSPCRCETPTTHACPVHTPHLRHKTCMHTYTQTHLNHTTPTGDKTH